MVPLTESLDVIVGDGGSTDGSLEPEFLDECQVRTKLTKTGPGKLSAQMRMAIHYALEQGYEGVIVVDGNDKDDTSAAPLFVQKLDEGYDHIQGSRYVPGGKAINTPAMRHYGVKFIHAPLMTFAARRKCTDTTNGFRGYSKKLLTDPRVKPLRSVFMAYELHYYLQIRAARLGFKVCEVPVTRAYPADGAIPTKISGMRGNIFVLKTLFRAVLGKYNP